MRPHALRETAGLCRAALEPYAGAGDWSAPAGDLEWSCRSTLAHVLSALTYYAVNLATRSTEERHSGQSKESLPIEQLIDALEGRAVVLAEVVAGAPESARGAHSMGMADPSGFVAMACDEMIVHTDDIVGGLGGIFEPPEALARAVVERLFPWAPPGEDAWATLLWANGRAPLGERPRLAGDWVWWCAPLAEWDGADPTA